MMQFPQYESYKETGFDWLGEIPKHWQLLRTKNIFRLVAEPAPKNNNEELLSVYSDIGVKPRKELEERGNKASTTDGYWLVRKGDVIVNKLLAWMGAIGVSEYDGVTSPAYDILRAYKDIDSKFYHYLFRNPICISKLKKHSKGIMEMRLRLYFDEFGDIKIPYPPIEDQRRIVRFLDQKTAEIDEAIAKKQKLIELLQEQKAILINRAVTKGLYHNVTMRDSGIEWIGEIPEHWEVKRLKFVAQIIAGQSPHESTYNSVGVGSILVNGPVEFSSGDLGKTVETKWTTSPKKFVPQETLLFCLRGSTTGRLNVSHKSLSIGRGVAGIIFSPKDSNSFYHYVIWSLAQQIRGTFKGSTFPSITSPQLGNYLVPIVPIREQSEIDKHIKQIEEDTTKVIDSVRKELNSLQELKQILISNAVTGKIKI